MARYRTYAFNYNSQASELSRLGRIAVKVINCLRDKVMKVFRVE
jgi:hypothetical protein